MKSEYDANKGFAFTPNNKHSVKRPISLCDRLKAIKVVSVFKWTLYFVIGVVLFNLVEV